MYTTVYAFFLSLSASHTASDAAPWLDYHASVSYHQTYAFINSNVTTTVIFILSVSITVHRTITVTNHRNITRSLDVFITIMVANLRASCEHTLHRVPLKSVHVNHLGSLAGSCKCDAVGDGRYFYHGVRALPGALEFW